MRQILFRSGYQKYVLGFGFGFGLLFSIRLWGMEPTQDAVLLAAVYWGVMPDSGLLGLLMPLIPVMVVCAILSNFLADDRAIVGVYLLPRAVQMRKWYLPKLCALWLHALEFTAIFMGSIIAVQRDFSWKMLLLVLYYALSLATASTLIAVLSLRFPAKWVVIGGVLLSSIAMLTAKPAKEHPVLTKLHPLYHFFSEWKNSAGFSVAYLLFFVAIGALVGGLLIRQKDIFLTRKDNDG